MKFLRELLLIFFLFFFGLELYIYFFDWTNYYNEKIGQLVWILTAVNLILANSLIYLYGWKRHYERNAIISMVIWLLLIVVSSRFDYIRRLAQIEIDKENAIGYFFDIEYTKYSKSVIYSFKSDNEIFYSEISINDDSKPKIGDSALIYFSKKFPKCNKVRFPL